MTIYFKNKSKYQNEFVENYLLSVYPNPTKDFILLKQDESLVGQYVTIYDIIRRIIFNEKYKNKININFLVAGLYTLEVNDGSIKKIV